MKAHTILFVKDQAASTQFYSAVLNLAPTLNVPGMTEFRLSETFVLGLMPLTGARKILGENVLPADEITIPKSELYLSFANYEDYFSRAVQNGARIVSPISKRNWGDTAGYVSDPDGHIVAFSSLS